MSAIQEALNLREDPPAPARAAEPAPPTAPAADPFANIAAEVAAERPSRRRPTRSAPPIDEDLFLAETVGRAPAPAPAAVEEVRPAQRAANDDRQSIGQILQSLQHRPPRTSYLVATMFALAWVAGGLILAGIYLPNLQATLGESGGLAVLVGIAAIVLAPIAFFYVLAYLMGRSQEMRIIAQSMASVARPSCAK